MANPGPGRLGRGDGVNWEDAGHSLVEAYFEV